MSVVAVVCDTKVYIIIWMKLLLILSFSNISALAMRLTEWLLLRGVTFDYRKEKREDWSDMLLWSVRKKAMTGNGCTNETQNLAIQLLLRDMIYRLPHTLLPTSSHTQTLLLHNITTITTDWTGHIKTESTINQNKDEFSAWVDVWNLYTSI